MTSLCKAALSVAFVGLFSAHGVGQVTKQGSAYLLRVRYSKGQVLTYKTINGVEGDKGPGAGLRLNMPLTLTVTDVKGPYATVRCKVGPALNGKAEMFPSQTVIVRINNRNDTDNKAAAPVGMGLPKNAVRVGETWESDAPVNMGNGGVKTLHAIYKFNGIKTVDGMEVAQLSYQVSGAAQGGGSMSLLVKDGTIWSNRSRLSLNMAGGKPLTLTFVVSRA
jgi:hypothetical protein